MKETILVAEDTVEVRSAVRRLLQRLGYKVIEADGAQRALEVAASLMEPIHLLLTDISMPGMDGHELAETFKALRPGVPVIFMSGHARESVAGQGGGPEGIHYVEKPFSLEQLGEQIRVVLDQRTGAGQSE